MIRTDGIGVAWGAVGLLLASFWGGPTTPAQAAMGPCPQSGTIFLCQVVDGDSVLDVHATNDGGGDLRVVGLTIGGISHLFQQGFFVFDRSTGEAPDFVLGFARVDPQQRRIEVSFTELEFGAVTAQVTFTLQDFGDESEVIESVSIRSNLTETIFGRAYVLTDFDVSGTPEDDQAFTTLPMITQFDSAATATLEVVGGQAPDGFQVSPYPSLSDPLFGDTFVNLANTTDPGPADLEAAFSWDKTFNGIGDTFQTTLRKSVTVLAGEDTDGDGIPDEQDNCPFEPNPGQDPNACLCGDINGDGEIDFVDARLIFLGQAGPRRCDVNADGECDFIDGRLVVLGQTPADQCPAATSPP